MKKLLTPKNIGFVVLAIVVAYSAVFFAPQKKYDVVRVIDGDTIVIDDGGEEQSVRLLGIDAPEVRPQTECFAEEGGTALFERIGGEKVRLVFDESQNMQDIYGRVLALVYLPDGTLLNEYMVQEGYAVEYTYITPHAHQTDFREIEADARSHARGLWGACHDNLPYCARGVSCSF